jgi:hypothetical protein
VWRKDGKGPKFSRQGQLLGGLATKHSAVMRVGPVKGQ